MNAMYECPICYEEASDAENLDCHHNFCAGCLQTFIVTCIESGKIPIPCPHVHCKSALSDTQVENLLNETQAESLIMYKECKQKRGKRSRHSTPVGTKPCSHCGVFIEKAAGCDHIVCPMCQQDFCYACGTHEYLSGELIRSCSNCSRGYIDHRYYWRYRLYMLLILPCYLLLILIWIPVAILILSLSGCFCCCFGCGLLIREPERRNSTFVGAYVLTFLFFPLIAMALEMGFQNEQLMEMLVIVGGLSSVESTKEEGDNEGISNFAKNERE